MITNELSNDEYHALDSVSSSDVKAVLLSTVWHWHNHTYKETPSMQLGTAVHDMALEGGENTVRGPETRRGNAWKDLEAECKAKGKTLLTEKDYDLADDITKALYADPRCAKQLTAKSARKEHSIIVTCPETGLELRCRPDIYNVDDQVMSDVKATVDPSPTGFGKQIYKYRYDAQAFFYKYVAELAGWPVKHFTFLAVGNTPPHAAHMHVMSGEAFALAKDDVLRALNEIAEAKRANKYETGWDRFTMIYPPQWMMTE